MRIAKSQKHELVSRLFSVAAVLSVAKEFSTIHFASSKIPKDKKDNGQTTGAARFKSDEEMAMK